MSNHNKNRIYIERNDDGNYTAKFGGAPSPIITAPTQASVETFVKTVYPNTPYDIERVRNTSKGERDKWR